MKIIYTREDGGLSVVVAAPKEHLERVLGPLTETEYMKHVLDRSIPEEATKVKIVTDEDIPPTKEFRNAWVDTTDDNKINIDVAKVKELKLEELRRVRNEKLAESDIELTRALELNDEVKLNEVKARRTKLRDATKPLKAVKAEGVVDDQEMIELIKQLGNLQDT